jgi:hypothetical protein
MTSSSFKPDQPTPWRSFILRPGWQVWGLVWLGWVLLLQAGRWFSPRLESPEYSLVIYLAGLALGLAILVKHRQGRPPSATIPPGRPWWRYALAISLACLSLATSSVFLWLYSVTVMSDSNAAYISYQEALESYGTPITTAYYTSLNELFNTQDSPLAIVLFQMGVLALAIGWWVWTVSHFNPAWAALSGLFLALDPTIARFQGAIITEPLFISLVILALTWFVRHQIIPRQELPAWDLYVGGLVYGAMLSIRVAGLYSLAIILAAYVILRLPWRKWPFLLAGLLTMLGVGVGLYRYGFGEWRFYGSSESYLQYPFYRYELLDPQAGAQSQTLYDVLETCQYLPYGRSITEYFTIRSILADCLSGQGITAQTFILWSSQAYVESIRHDPWHFGSIILRELDRATFAPIQLSDFYVPIECTQTWCQDFAHERPYLHPQQLDGLYEGLRFITQPYLLLDSNASQTQDLSFEIGVVNDPTYPFSTLASFLMLWGFLVVVHGKPEQQVSLLIGFFLAYFALIIIVGQYVMQRYMIALVPFHLILASLFWTTLAQVLPRPGWRIPFAPRYGLALAGILSAGCLALAGYFLADWWPYRQPDLIEEAQAELAHYTDGAVFNPRVDNFAWDAGLFFDITQLDKQQQMALSDWQNTLNPMALKELGATYLLIDSKWLAYRRQVGDQAILDDPSYYTLVQHWDNGRYGDDLWLYRLP